MDNVDNEFASSTPPPPKKNPLVLIMEQVREGEGGEREKREREKQRRVFESFIENTIIGRAPH